MGVNMEKELHLFIIWENARYKQNEILDDIKKDLKILNVYDIEWSKESFSNNLTRFYGTNLPVGSAKEVHCGNGKFLLVIVQDLNPRYEDRETSKGKKSVNINMFDKKTKYRELTGGGHRVHATDNQKETNHDLTLLLGKNVNDYISENSENEWDGNVISFSNDLIGCQSWKNAGEMFYALNNCANYAILRNYESLPEEIYVNEHNDIDLICESMIEVAYILNAKPMHQESYRVQHQAKVEDKIAYFDLRNLGDDYYYRPLEEKMLENRIYNEKGFYVLDKENYFYTLLYHALIQKPEFKQDYKKKLMDMNIENVDMETTLEEYGNILKKWMIKNEYIALEPIDKTVYFNKETVEYLKPLVYRECYVQEENVQVNELMELNSNLRAENEVLKQQNAELADALSGIRDSRAWKITEPLRKITKRLRKG